MLYFCFFCSFVNFWNFSGQLLLMNKKKNCNNIQKFQFQFYTGGISLSFILVEILVLMVTGFLIRLKNGVMFQILWVFFKNCDFDFWKLDWGWRTGFLKKVMKIVIFVYMFTEIFFFNWECLNVTYKFVWSHEQNLKNLTIKYLVHWTDASISIFCSKVPGMLF